MASHNFHCDACDKGFTVEDYWWGKIGANVTCTNCGVVYETDWDYMDYDTVGAWLTNVVSTPEDKDGG